MKFLKSFENNIEWDFDEEETDLSEEHQIIMKSYIAEFGDKLVSIKDRLNFAFNLSNVTNVDKIEIYNIIKNHYLKNENFNWYEEEFDEEEIDEKWDVVNFDKWSDDQLYIITKYIDDDHVVIYGDSDYKISNMKNFYTILSDEELKEVIRNNQKIKIYGFHGRRYKHFDDVRYGDLPQEVKNKL